MLVLSRKVAEEIVVKCPDGDEISVCVVRLSGDKVRLGFTAPDDYLVLRRELLEPSDELKRERGVIDGCG